MSIGRTKKFGHSVRPAVVVLGVMAVMCVLCQAQPAISRLEQPAAERFVNEIAEDIQHGRFDDARQRLQENPSPSSAAVMQLARLMAEHDALVEKRNTEQAKVYHEKLDELNKLRDENPQTLEKIDRVFAAVSSLIRYADETEKKAIVEAPDILAMTELAVKFAEKLEQKGQWSDAYAQCYHWLSSFHEDNDEYKSHAEKLLSMTTLEISLKDTDCEKAIEKYHGITAEMFMKALEALNFKYVTAVDYEAMTDKALRQCELLGHVLAKNRDQIAFRADDEAVKLWLTGIEALRDESLESCVKISHDVFVKVFKDVMNLNHVSIRLPPEVLTAQFTEAALSALDPYTSLVWPEEITEFQKNIRQEFTGIGIRISKESKKLKIISLLPNTPAFLSGLDAGDIIVSVDGEPTENMTSNCAVKKISGPKGSKVILTVKNEDSDLTRNISIVRDKIVIPTVRGGERADKTSRGKWRHMIDPINGIGYIRVSNFAEDTVHTVEKILAELEERDVKGLIIDLRSNSGGLLSSAVGMVDLFIDNGLILRNQPRRYMVPDLWMAHANGTHPDYPIVVLINGGSASASEIVAGALRDPKYKRATLVGSRSYGKGSVQEITGFTGGGSQFKFTTAHYYLPSGDGVKNRYLAEKIGQTDWGITPDVEIELLSSEQRRLFRQQRTNDILSKSDVADTNDPNLPGQNVVQKDFLAETIQIDPQLAMGLIVLKSKIISAGQSVSFGVTAKHDTAAGPVAHEN